MLAAFACSVGAFVLLWDKPEDERVVSDTLYTWLSAGEFRVEMNILFDPLSAVMLLVVTGVGFLIHVYSIGYMRGDAEERRFFAYLNLFVFSMLLLVLAGNFVLLLAGWGMVGLSSYLLIGYWHQRKSAVDAAKKAFVMNAIGDVGLAIGIFLIFRELGTVDYLQVFAGRDVLGDDSTITNWVCVLLLIGALAKSAQVPLHTWLPDAMEGPTPVSALIHAATMVTAGVYLIARMNPLFDYAPSISDAVVVIGVIGLLMAGLIAIVQTDIKRIIAYSTMSQIAYMFVGVGPRRVLGGHVPPRHARLLQGPAVHGRGHRDPRPQRRAGRAADGRPAGLPAEDVRLHVDRHAGARRHLPAVGRLLEGRHHRQRPRRRTRGPAGSRSAPASAAPS